MPSAVSSAAPSVGYVPPVFVGGAGQPVATGQPTASESPLAEFFSPVWGGATPAMLPATLPPVAGPASEGRPSNPSPAEALAIVVPQGQGLRGQDVETAVGGPAGTPGDSSTVTGSNPVSAPGAIRTPTTPAEEVAADEPAPAEAVTPDETARPYAAQRPSFDEEQAASVKSPWLERRKAARARPVAAAFGDSADGAATATPADPVPPTPSPEEASGDRRATPTLLAALVVAGGYWAARTYGRQADAADLG